MNSLEILNHRDKHNVIVSFKWRAWWENCKDRLWGHSWARPTTSCLHPVYNLTATKERRKWEESKNETGCRQVTNNAIQMLWTHSPVVWENIKPNYDQQTLSVCQTFHFCACHWILSSDKMKALNVEESVETWSWKKTSLWQYYQRCWGHLVLISFPYTVKLYLLIYQLCYFNFAFIKCYLKYVCLTDFKSPELRDVWWLYVQKVKQVTPVKPEQTDRQHIHCT